MHNQEVIKSVKLDFGVIELQKGNVLAFYPAEHIDTINMDQLLTMQDVLIVLANGKPKPFFSDNRRLLSLGYKERQHIGKNIHLFASASAVTATPLVRFIGHTITHLFKPKIPMRFFKTEEEAFLWLKEISNET